jgi:hypothetical protein
MSQGYKLPCGCVVERGTERIIEQCSCCAAEFSERHERAVEGRRSAATVPTELLMPRLANPSRVPEDVQ